MSSFPEIDKMVAPGGRWPLAVIDDRGKVWLRSKTKGWFERLWQDDRGGKGSLSTHLTHPKLSLSKKVMTRKEYAAIPDWKVQEALHRAYLG